MDIEHLPIEEMQGFCSVRSCRGLGLGSGPGWPRFEQDTIGVQLVRAVDSIGANLVEGDGRYRIPDSIHFFVIARASAREARLWIDRARKRNLLHSEAELMLDKLNSATQLLNRLISYRRKVMKAGLATLGLEAPKT